MWLTRVRIQGGGVTVSLTGLLLPPTWRLRPALWGDSRIGGSLAKVDIAFRVCAVCRWPLCLWQHLCIVRFAGACARFDKRCLSPLVGRGLCAFLREDGTVPLWAPFFRVRCTFASRRSRSAALGFSLVAAVRLWRSLCRFAVAPPRVLVLLGCRSFRCASATERW